MRKVFLLLLCCSALAASACHPARSGLAGNTLTTNQQPEVSITAASDLVPAAAGRKWLTMPAPSMTSFPTAEAHYAIFSDGGSGPVQRHAHIFLVRLEDPVSWRFQPEGAAPETMAVHSEGDWPSGFWLANGRDVPVKWLARRWSTLRNDWVKTVSEYREPWPACLDEDALDGALGILTPEAGECFRAFSDRANAAFSSSEQNTPLPDNAFLPATLPETRFNVRALVGEVEETGSDGGDVYD